MNRRGYCIYIDTFFQGPVPTFFESNSDDNAEHVCVFPTELEAQREIVDFMMTRLQEFLDGQRDFEDTVTLQEYVVEVDVLPDGSIVDSDGKRFERGWNASE